MLFCDREDGKSGFFSDIQTEGLKFKLCFKKFSLRKKKKEKILNEELLGQSDRL